LHYPRYINIIFQNYTNNLARAAPPPYTKTADTRVPRIIPRPLKNTKILYLITTTIAIISAGIIHITTLIIKIITRPIIIITVAKMVVVPINSIMIATIAISHTTLCKTPPATIVVTT
jgi:hypothetical protein